MVCPGRPAVARRAAEQHQPTGDALLEAEAVVDDMIGRARAEIGDVGLHRIEVAAEQFKVAAEFVLLPWHENEGRAPFR